MVCTFAARFFVAAYLLALVAWLIGTNGWFGAERDPLSGVFLVLLGLPWTTLVDFLPERLWPAAASLTPLANLAVLVGICRLLRRNRTAERT